MVKVSVIVPVYNSYNYLDKCINSLMNQTLNDIEIVCVDDGSTDDSLKKLNSFKDDRVKVIHKENGGQASARNVGILKATGDYILFIDSDDYVELDMCEKLYNYASQKKCDIVICDLYKTINENDEYIKVLNEKTSGLITLRDYLFSDVGPCNKLYKTKMLKDSNFKFPEGIIYEDYAIIPSLVKYCHKVYYLNEAFLHYVQTDSSTMRSDVYKEKYEDIFKASDILYNSLINTEYTEELEFLLATHLLYLGSLNFYRFDKFRQIDKISNFMNEKFPRWKKNKYVKRMTFKEKVLMQLFYKKKYGVIKFIQRLKGRYV